MTSSLAVERGVFIEARRILSSSATLKGVDYLQSPLKRRLDMIMAGVLSAGAFLPIVLLGTAVWAQDRHTPFISLLRTNPATAQKIPIWKIRTMIPNASSLESEMVGDRSLAEFKTTTQDPRVTRFGRHLRKLSLDELPQLLQASRGDLSLVGSRIFSDSELRYHVLPNVSEDPYRQLMGLLSMGMKFGVTGFYGIMGRANIPIRARTQLDVMYGLDANIIADLRILAATVTSVL